MRAGDEACTDPAYPYCYSYTLVNQWACETCPGTPELRCARDPVNLGCRYEGSDPANCGYANPACYQVCMVNGTVHNPSCQLLQLNAQCNTSAGFCSWTGDLTNCYWQNNNTVCNEQSQVATRSCCGCANPPCDSGRTPTPTPTPPPPCGATNPTAATLVSPANGGSVSGNSVVLQWQPPEGLRPGHVPVHWLP